MLEVAYFPRCYEGKVLVVDGEKEREPRPFMGLFHQLARKALKDISLWIPARGCFSRLYRSVSTSVSASARLDNVAHGIL